MSEKVDDTFMDRFQKWPDRKPARLPKAQMAALLELHAAGLNPPGTSQCGKAIDIKTVRSVTLKILAERHLAYRTEDNKWYLTWRGLSYLQLRGEVPGEP